MFRFVIGARRNVRLLFITAFAATLGTVAANASDHKIALVPGGPHPYFAAWEQAANSARQGRLTVFGQSRSESATG